MTFDEIGEWFTTLDERVHNGLVEYPGLRVLHNFRANKDSTEITVYLQIAGQKRRVDMEVLMEDLDENTTDRLIEKIRSMVTEHESTSIRESE